MDKLPYKVIKSERQYYEYCDELEEMVMLKRKSKLQQDIIDLLTLLIEKWDEEHNPLMESDPIEILRFLMVENELKSVDLAKILKISTSMISDILNRRRGLSKGIIRKLSNHFKVTQELFNRPYKLVSPINSHLKNASVMNTPKVN